MTEHVTAAGSRTTGRLIGVFIVSLFLLGTIGCEDQSPIEEAAEETEDAVEEMGDEIEDAADEIDGELDTQ